MQKCVCTILGFLLGAIIGFLAGVHWMKGIALRGVKEGLQDSHEELQRKMKERRWPFVN